MRIVLTRHGETEENIRNIIQGSGIQGKLSSLGIKQAGKLAERLKGEKFDHIYSSSLDRAAETAKIIAKFHPDIPIDFVDGLKEIDMGSKTGTVGNKNHDANLLSMAKDAESFEHAQKRVKKLIDAAYSRYPKGNVLFVAHGHINKVLLSVIENKPAESIFTYKNPGNTAVSVFELKEYRNHAIHLLNCTKHLD